MEYITLYYLVQTFVMSDTFCILLRAVSYVSIAWALSPWSSNNKLFKNKNKKNIQFKKHMSLSMVVGKNKYFIGKVFNNKWIKVDINIWKFSNVFPSINNFQIYFFDLTECINETDSDTENYRSLWFQTHYDITN